MGTLVITTAEIAARVIAGLIDSVETRQTTIARFRETVEQAVTELDPDRTRDTRPSWLNDIPRWVRLADPLDRFRRAYDDLLILEAQAGETVNGLRAAFTGSVPRPPVTAAHRFLADLAGRRDEHVRQMTLAERRLRPRLQPGTAAAVRSTIRELRHQNDITAAQLERLHLLLLMSGD